MDATSKFKMKWKEFFHGENILLYLIKAGGVLSEIAIKEVSATFEYFEEIIEMEENRVLGNYKIVMIVSEQEVVLNLIEFYKVRIHEEIDPIYNNVRKYEEHIFDYKLLVNGDRESYFRPFGKPLAQAFQINENEEKELKRILITDFAIWQTVVALFRTEQRQYTETVLNNNSQLPTT